MQWETSVHKGYLWWSINGSLTLHVKSLRSKRSVYLWEINHCKSGFVWYAIRLQVSGMRMPERYTFLSWDVPQHNGLDALQFLSRQVRWISRRLKILIRTRDSMMIIECEAYQGAEESRFLRVMPKTVERRFSALDARKRSILWIILGQWSFQELQNGETDVWRRCERFDFFRCQDVCNVRYI